MKYLAKSALLSGTYYMLISVLLTRKTWNLVSVLDMDDMASHRKFGKVTWPKSRFIDYLYFADQLFLSFYRLLCKIANLGYIYLKFSRSISDNNIDNPAKFCDISMPKICISKNRDFCILVCISKNRYFRYFGLYFTEMTTYVKILFDFVPPDTYQHHLFWRFWW